MTYQLRPPTDGIPVRPLEEMLDPPPGYESWDEPGAREELEYQNGNGVPPGFDNDLVVRPFRRIPIDLRQPLPAITTVAGYIYEGRLTVLQSEPGVGKSFLGTWWTMAVIETGRDVVYIDEEGGPDLIHTRLTAMGADPDLVDEHLRYYAFEARQWDDHDLASLDQLLYEVDGRAGLAVLDSLPDFLAAARLSEDSAQDVTSFIGKVCGRFRAVGCAQLLLDHLVKPQASSRKERSRYSRGSGAKLAKADATLLLETEAEFDVSTSGKLRLWKTKDRHGRLGLPALGKPGLGLRVEVGGASGEGQVRFVEEKPTRSETEVWDGPTACMEAVLALLQETPGVELSARSVETQLRARNASFRSVTIREAAERLAVDGRLRVRNGPRASRMFLWMEGIERLPDEF